MEFSNLCRCFVATALLFAVACAQEEAPRDLSASDRPPSRYADLILKNGSIYTVDAVRSWAQALAIKDGRIAFVGSDAEVDSYADESTDVVDLGGKMVLPGFHDIHIHPVHSGVTYQQCHLFDLHSLEEILARVATCAEETESPWIRGGGWLVDNFAPSGLPDKKLLDAIVPGRPVSLKSSDGHSLWVNSKALEVAGITAESKDPPSGRIDRYLGSNEPSGSLQEDAAMMLVMSKEPPLTQEEAEAGLTYAIDHLHGFGITGVQDAIVKLDPGDPYAGFPAYHALDDRGELDLHVVAAMFYENGMGIDEQIERFVTAREEHTRGNVRATSIKIWLDGVIEAQTAALLEPYADRADAHKGALAIEPHVLNDLITKLDARGFQIHFHAIGDAAIRASLDALEAAIVANGAGDSRHHVSHLELFAPAEIPRFAELNVIANFQPLWGIRDRYITELTLPRVGEERGRWLYPIASVLDTGAVVAFGSDWYVSSANPLLGIEAAVTRLGPSGETEEMLFGEERISLADAIAGYTIRAAYVNFLDDETGSIEVGKFADLAVLDRNLFAVPPSEISEANVVATLFRGELVHGSLEAVARLGSSE